MKTKKDKMKRILIVIILLGFILASCSVGPTLEPKVEIVYVTPTPIYVTSTPEPTPTQIPPTPEPIYKSVTWMELVNFLELDHTNWNEFKFTEGIVDYPNRYVCHDFAIDLATNAKNSNLEAINVVVVWEDDTSHEFVEFTTTDKYKVWVEPQSDYAYVQINTVPNYLCEVRDTKNCFPQKVKAIYWYKIESCNHETWTCENPIKSIY